MITNEYYAEQFTDIVKIIERDCIIDNSYHVFISVASHCKYYEEVKDE